MTNESIMVQFQFNSTQTKKKEKKGKRAPMNKKPNFVICSGRLSYPSNEGNIVSGAPLGSRILS